MTLYYSVWILLCLKVKIHCAGNIILAKLSSIMSRIWGRICSHGCSHSQNHTAGMIWRDTVPNRGDRDKNHHGTTFSMSVSVPHHLSWKFCVSCTWALHCCQNITFPTPLLFTFCIHSHIHSFMERHRYPTKFCMQSQMLCNVQFCEADITVTILSQWSYHFHCRKHTWNACRHIYL